MYTQARYAHDSSLNSLKQNSANELRLLFGTLEFSVLACSRNDRWLFPQKSRFHYYFFSPVRVRGAHSI